MSSGIALTYNGVFTDSALPFYVDDPVLSPGAGSLVLIDTRTWSSGVPADGALLHNVASAQLAAAGVTGVIDGAVNYRGSLLSSEAKFERSAKGGLHGIITQNSTLALDKGLNLNIPIPVLAWMIAHPTHHYYFSLWSNLTRIAKTTSPDGAKTFFAIENGGAFGFARIPHSSTQLLPISGNQDGFTAPGGLNTAGARYISVGGLTNDTTLSQSNYQSFGALAVAQWGSVLKQNYFATIDAALPSWVFYRAYIEDLTLSGRSYVAVNAIDQALYAAAVGAGGWINGDTFTAPSTLP